MIKFSTILGGLFILLFLSMLNLSFLTNYDDGVASLSGPWGMFKMVSRMLFILMGAYYLVARVRHFSVVYKGPMFYLLLFFLLALVSIIYSSDTALSTIRLVEHSGIFIGVAALWLSIAPERRANHVLSLILIGCCCLVLIVWSFVIIDPLLAFRQLGSVGPVLGGSVLHSHTLGHCSVYVILILFSRWNQILQNRVGFITKSVFVVFLLVTIGLTQSRSSIVILLVGVFVILASKTSVTHRFKNLRRYSIIIISIFAFISMFPYVYEIFSRDGDISSLKTMGNRSLIWTVITTQVLTEAPLFGYGYQMLSLNGAEFELVPSVMRSMAHNAYIQTLGGLGLFGFLLIIVQSGVTYFHVLKPPKLILESFDQTVRRHYVLLAIVCLGSSLTEFGMVGPTSPAVPMYFVLVVYASFIMKNRVTAIDRFTKNIHQARGLQSS